MRLKSIYKQLRNVLIDSHKRALADGLIEGEGCSIIGRRVNFGSEPYLIKLGNHVRVSFNVTFVTHDGGTWAFRDIPQYSDVIKYGAIVVGDNSFIGCHSIILPGVTIGKRCVIGAGSVVTKDIPDGMVACGVPARVIMTTEEYAEKSKSNMLPYDKDKYSRNKKAYLQELLMKE